MLGLFRKSTVGAVSFCERCGVVCDRACRADAARAEARRLAFSFPSKLA